MGWAGGSSLANDIWVLVRKFVPESQRSQVARLIIDRFKDEDADDWDYDDVIMLDSETE